MNLNDFSSLGLLVVIAAAVYIAWQLYRGRKPESLGEWAMQVEAAVQWGMIAVEAAEQLFSSGQIDKGERFHHADMFLAQTLPNLTADQRRMVIEAAVGGMNYIRNLHARDPDDEYEDEYDDDDFPQEATDGW